ncbi:hypothetical protein BDK51DRAFT_50016 [Blyttiomyces helicus]|uniref:Uncharacterized protein n=1 Tax=Blyttiomyces helicus TaxID=388810 RepID=A0A4P9W944_9FUNG|nr:hypothetical protein BDK51DRAFT_50016 [Blyttiomyces helicus]|eukprot:RKO86716.1 hypothetical protein BDK51DRAFT_50016 [Blyttiomyces helicus]
MSGGVALEELQPDTEGKNHETCDFDHRQRLSCKVGQSPHKVQSSPLSWRVSLVARTSAAVLDPSCAFPNVQSRRATATAKATPVAIVSLKLSWVTYFVPLPVESVVERMSAGGRRRSRTTEHGSTDSELTGAIGPIASQFPLSLSPVSPAATPEDVIRDAPELSDEDRAVVMDFLHGRYSACMPVLRGAFFVAAMSIKLTPPHLPGVSDHRRGAAYGQILATSRPVTVTASSGQRRI